MITPEPRITTVPVEPGVRRIVRVPAAGHLGVIEERCPSSHYEDGKQRIVQHAASPVDVFAPCPTCRAEV